MADESYYAWSELRLGGESELVENATGVKRRIVQSRDVVQPGEKVSKADLKKRGVSDAEWDAWVEGGVVRAYPMPKMPEGSTQSPTDFVMESLRTGNREDLDPNMVLSLALSGTHSVPRILDTIGEEVKEVAK